MPSDELADNELIRKLRAEVELLRGRVEAYRATEADNVSRERRAFWKGAHVVLGTLEQRIGADFDAVWAALYAAQPRT